MSIISKDKYLLQPSEKDAGGNQMTDPRTGFLPGGKDYQHRQTILKISLYL